MNGWGGGQLMASSASQEKDGAGVYLWLYPPYSQPHWNNREDQDPMRPLDHQINETDKGKVDWSRVTSESHRIDLNRRLSAAQINLCEARNDSILKLVLR